MHELERIKHEPVPAVELRKIKEYIKGNTLLSLERSTYVAHWAGWQELMLGTNSSLTEFVLDKIDEVTAERSAGIGCSALQYRRFAPCTGWPLRDMDILKGLLTIWAKMERSADFIIVPRSSPTARLWCGTGARCSATWAASAPMLSTI